MGDASVFLEYAKKIYPNRKVLSILGGFHLFDVSNRLSSTIQYLTDTGIRELYPCHCVSFKAKAEIARHMHVHEAGVGVIID